MPEDGNRISQIRGSILSAQDQGLSGRDIREAVIAQVAENNPNNEGPQTIFDGINKYYITSVGDENVPVVLVSPHGHNPSRSEIVDHLKRVISPKEINELSQEKGLIDTWISIRNDRAQWSEFKKKNPRYFDLLYRLG